MDTLVASRVEVTGDVTGDVEGSGDEVEEVALDRAGGDGECGR